MQLPSPKIKCVKVEASVPMQEPDLYRVSLPEFLHVTLHDELTGSVVVHLLVSSTFSCFSENI